MERVGLVSIVLYLAGAIGEAVDAQEWRLAWKGWLEGLGLGIKVLDPLVERDGLLIGSKANRQNRAYIRRNDRILISQAHILLIVHNLKIFSIGTWVEMAWARDEGAYIILFVPDPDEVSRRRAGNVFAQMCDEIIFGDREQLRRTLEALQQFEGKAF